jgi:colicin import membrane protein
MDQQLVAVRQTCRALFVATGLDFCHSNIENFDDVMPVSAGMKRKSEERLDAAIRREEEEMAKTARSEERLLDAAIRREEEEMAKTARSEERLLDAAIRREEEEMAAAEEEVAKAAAAIRREEEEEFIRTFLQAEEEALERRRQEEEVAKAAAAIRRGKEEGFNRSTFLQAEEEALERRRQERKRKHALWTAELDETITRMRADGISFSKISSRLGNALSKTEIKNRWNHHLNA